MCSSDLLERRVPAVEERPGERHAHHRAVPVAMVAVLEALEGEVEVGEIVAARERDGLLVARDGGGARGEFGPVAAGEGDQAVERPGDAAVGGIGGCAEGLVGRPAEELVQTRGRRLAREPRRHEPGRDVRALDVGTQDIGLSPRPTA